jgi:DNA-binding NtrC family response regulator
VVTPAATLATCIVEGDRARLELEHAELKVQTGPDRGLTVALGTDTLLIGTSSSCELKLHDPTVSGRHAEVSLTTRGYVIRDLGSTNGIWSGAIAVERARLADGMRIDLGDTTLLVRSLKKQRSIALAKEGSFGLLVARSLKMRALAAELEQLAQTDTTVLIEGETGSGKERVAETLHQLSARRRGPFVVFDCGAAQPSLLQAELFGYEKGAFTGADRSRPGILIEAEGGTLFLDEIGEVPLQAQSVLLRAIEQRTSRPLGGRAERQHDVRIVAATNRNLAAEVKAQRFREDLFHRLAVARVKVPPLRERREDVASLATEFASQARVALPTPVLLSFETFAWPGNVRELRNTVLRLAAGDGTREPIGSDLAPPSGADEVGLCDPTGTLLPLSELRRKCVEDFERRYLTAALRRAGGSLAKAAELAGLQRQSFTHLAEKLGLHRRTPRS